MRLITLLVVLTPALCAQIGFGVKAGVPLTDTFQIRSVSPTFFVTETRRYTVGPMFEVRLPFRVAIELDMLYKSINYRSAQAETSGNAWQFPLVLKYRVRDGLVRPYLAGGVALQRLSGLTQVPGLFGSDEPEELRRRTVAGYVAGAGIEIRALILRISPEIRYTRWNADSFRDPATGGDLLRSNRNQAEFLVGFTF